jgi:hypothetical protein
MARALASPKAFRSRGVERQGIAGADAAKNFGVAFEKQVIYLRH